MSDIERKEPDWGSRLKDIFADRVTTAPAIIDAHSHGESYHAPDRPHAVCFPESEAEVIEFVTFCNIHGVPIIPFGAGTSLEGQVSAVQGGLCMDLSRMNHILSVNAEDMDCTVEPGVTRHQLNESLRDSGLYFPVDPGAEATLGGMAATRASGTTTVRYGSMRENVISLRVVLPDGSAVTTASRSRKSASGYDLTRLFVGSEGTLGIITGITLRLQGIPEATAVALCAVDRIEVATDAVIQIIQLGIPVSRIELADEVQMRAINAYSKLELAESPTIWIEIGGSAATVTEHCAEIAEVLGAFSIAAPCWAHRHEERQALWKARHSAAYANKSLRPGSQIFATDVCVPISRLAECIAETKRDLQTSSLTAPLVGHVGDGNFHLNFVLDLANADELTEAQRLNGALVERALRMGGTCTGEHGVGIGKIAFAEQEHGAAIDVMRRIKHALDPANIMNPGKMFRMDDSR